LWGRGDQGTTITDLSAAMGVHPPSLYAAFGSKEELFREAVALYDTLAGSSTQDALDAAPTARAAVEAMLRLHVELYTDPDKPTGCMVVLGASTWTPHNEAVREYLAGLRAKTHDALRERFSRGSPTATFRREPTSRRSRPTSTPCSRVCRSRPATASRARP
jgi:AcrR family transcriptional regulator